MNSLSADYIKNRAKEYGFVKTDGFSLSCLESVDSTNMRIKEAIRQKAPEWTVVSALCQSKGYGRQGRTWSSPLGGLYVSLLLRPFEHPAFAAQGGKQHLPTLSLALSIAVCRFLDTLGVGKKAQVKWPNDIVVNLEDIDIPSSSECGLAFLSNYAVNYEGNAIGSAHNDVPHSSQGKLAGISVEMVDGAICAGIGINLFPLTYQADMSQKYRSISVLELIGQQEPSTSSLSFGYMSSQERYMEDALAVLLHKVQCVYNQWLVEGFPPFRDEYRAKSSLQGQVVRLVSLTHDILFEGVVCDIDAGGLLCLRDEEGVVTHAHSGEVHLM